MGRGYVFTVKGNTPTLHQQLKALPLEAAPGPPVCSTGHGRRTTCTFQFVAALVWVGCAGARQVRRTVTRPWKRASLPSPPSGSLLSKLPKTRAVLRCDRLCQVVDWMCISALPALRNQDAKEDLVAAVFGAVALCERRPVGPAQARYRRDAPRELVGAASDGEGTNIQTDSVRRTSCRDRTGSTAATAGTVRGMSEPHWSRQEMPVPQRDKKKIAGQQKAIKDHQAKKAAYPVPHDKAFAQKTIDNAQRHLDKLQGKRGR